MSVEVRRDEVAEVLAGDRLEGAAVVGVGRRGVGGGVGADLGDDLRGSHAGARTGDAAGAQAQGDRAGDVRRRLAGAVVRGGSAAGLVGDDAGAGGGDGVGLLGGRGGVVRVRPVVVVLLGRPGPAEAGALGAGKAVAVAHRGDGQDL